MCLLQSLNGHIRVTYPTSHQSVSSWPPALPRSAPDAHWSPLEARYLQYIRIASTAVIHPLICEKEEGRRACHALVLPLVECAPHVAAAECTTALSHAPSRRPPTLMPTAPSGDPKMQSRHRLFSPPLTPSSASHQPSVQYPLTCEKEEGRRACHALVLPLVECAPHVAAAECMRLSQLNSTHRIHRPGHW
jgi:hypothetical protein